MLNPYMNDHGTQTSQYRWTERTLLLGKVRTKFVVTGDVVPEMGQQIVVSQVGYRLQPLETEMALPSAGLPAGHSGLGVSVTSPFRSSCKAVVSSNTDERATYFVVMKLEPLRCST